MHLDNKAFCLQEVAELALLPSADEEDTMKLKLGPTTDVDALWLGASTLSKGIHHSDNLTTSLAKVLFCRQLGHAFQCDQHWVEVCTDIL
jgi:hypothetical protein